MVVAGAMRSDAGRRAAAALAARLGWPLLADINSGLRKPGAAGESEGATTSAAAVRSVPLYDLLLGAEEVAGAPPDVVLMAGEWPVSWSCRL